MRPRFIVNYCPNALDGDSVFLSNHLEVSATFPTFTNLLNLLWSKFRGMIFGSPHSAFWSFPQSLRITFGLPSLCVPISHVVLMRSKEKMCRVHTRRGIAAMKDLKPNRNTAIENKPRKSVGADIGTFEIKASVAGGEFPTNPEPALIGFGLLCVFPKAFNIALRWIDLARGLINASSRFIHSSIMFGFSEGRLATTSGLCALTLLTGCSINKLIPAPYAGAIVEHSRFFGLNAKIPYASSSVVEVQLGWGSHVWSLIPVSTNRIYGSPVSDTFRLDSGLNPFATEIIEDLQCGWDGQPPPARIKIDPPKIKPPNIKVPKIKKPPPNLSVEPMHSSVFQRQAKETVTISRQEYDSLKGAEKIRLQLQQGPK